MEKLSKKDKTAKYATPLKEMSFLEKVFLGAVAVVGFSNLGFIMMTLRSMYVDKATTPDLLNGILLALLLQAVLINTIFVWRISDSIEKKK